MGSSKQPPILAAYNHKGGTGKTTFLFNLAHYAMEHNKRVLAVCLDRQRDLLRMLKGHDSILKTDEVIERENLVAFYSPDKMVDLDMGGFDVALVDCPPARDISIRISPTGFIVPINGFNAYENFSTVARDLVRASDFVLAVINCAETTGTRDLNDLREAINAIPDIEVYPEAIAESGCIARCESQRLPAWRTTHSRRAAGRKQMEKLCRHVLKRAKITLGTRTVVKKEK